MRKQIIIIFLSLLFCNLNAYSQDYKVLVKADSLAKASEFKAALSLVTEVLDSNPRNFLKAQAYYQLSYLYLQLYEFEKAKTYNQFSLKIRDQIRYEFVADNYMRFGTIELVQGKYETALKYYQEAKELPHSDLQFSGILDGYIGAVYERLNNDSLALHYYKNSLEILSWELGDNHPDVSVAYYNLGNYFANKGNFKTAIVNYEKALLNELKNNWGQQAMNARLAKTYNALGLAIYKERLDFEDAISNFNGGLLASKGNRRLSAMSGLNLAQVYFLQQEYEKAEAELNKALDQLYIGEEEDPIYFIPLILDKGLYIRGLKIKTDLLLESYNTSNNVEDLIAAYEKSALAVEVFEGQILDYYKESHQLEIIGNSRDVYEQAMYLAIQVFDKNSDKKYIDKAFQIAEKGKAFVLKNQMLQLDNLLNDRIPTAIQIEASNLINLLTFYETDLALKYRKDNFRKEVLKLNRDYESLLKKIEKIAPEFYELKYRISDVSIRSIQDKLTEKEAVLSYYQGSEMYYVFAINKTDFEVYYNHQNAPLSLGSTSAIKDFKKKTKAKFPLPNQSGKSSDIPSLPKPDVGIYTQYTEDDLDLKSGVLTGRRGTIKLSKKDFVQANHILYRRLIEPVKSIIKRKKNLIIIPHGDLHFVTFETLLKSKPSKKIKYKKLKYLIKDYAISYALSADFISTPSDPSIESISTWAPVFNPKDSLGYIIDMQEVLNDTVNEESAIFRSVVPNEFTFKTLKYSEREVISILKIVAKKEREGKAFLKGDASEFVFKKEAPNYNILHLATHSFVNEKYPNSSGIAFSKSKGEDGILFAGEVMNLNLKKTELAVLSSCDSGSGRLQSGEGLLSLNRAFKFAGVKNTISTRWKVEDRTTSEMMEYFYSKILSGSTYSEALQYAKLKMIKKAKTSTPRIWAGFILTGR